MLSNSMHDIGSWHLLLNFPEISSTLHHGLCVFCDVTVASHDILPHLVHEGAVWDNSPASAVHLQIDGQSKHHISLTLGIASTCQLEKQKQR